MIQAREQARARAPASGSGCVVLYKGPARAQMLPARLPGLSGSSPLHFSSSLHDPGFGSRLGRRWVGGRGSGRCMASNGAEWRRFFWVKFEPFFFFEAHAVLE
jgi:hypothetical protein